MMLAVFMLFGVFLVSFVGAQSIFEINDANIIIPDGSGEVACRET